jgi:prevent-host-death family protein
MTGGLSIQGLALPWYASAPLGAANRAALERNPFTAVDCCQAMPSPNGAHANQPRVRTPGLGRTDQPRSEGAPHPETLVLRRFLWKQSAMPSWETTAPSAPPSCRRRWPLPKRATWACDRSKAVCPTEALALTSPLAKLVSLDNQPVGWLVQRMKTIGIFEAKTHLTAVCSEVARTGEPVLVSRRGQPLVVIGPPPASPQQERADIHTAWKTWEDAHPGASEDFPDITQMRQDRPGTLFSDD